MCHQLPGFERALREGNYQIDKVYADRAVGIDEDNLQLGFGAAEAIVIHPVIEGGKKRGLGKVILGTILIATAFFFAPTAAVAAAAGTTPMGTVAFAGITVGQLATQGILMAAAGASALLSPNVSAPKSAESQDSFLINATGNLIEEGAAIPVVYGEVFTGSVLVSSATVSEEYPNEDDEDDD